MDAYYLPADARADFQATLGLDVQVLGSVSPPYSRNISTLVGVRGGPLDRLLALDRVSSAADRLGSSQILAMR